MQAVIAEHADVTPSVSPALELTRLIAPPELQAPQTQMRTCRVHGTPMRPSKFQSSYCPRKNDDGSHCNETAA